MKKLLKIKELNRRLQTIEYDFALRSARVKQF